MNQDYIIGLDLGNNNVGWSVIDIKNRKIETKGVKTFSVSNAAADRKNIRNARRGRKRKNTRIKDCLKEFKSIGFPNKQETDSKLIEKRYRGIKEKVEKQDIVNIFCFLVSHRGYIPFGEEEVNFIDLNGKLPCEYYYDLYLRLGKYRNLDCTVKNSEIEKEILQLFKTQSDFYPELNLIQNKLIKIFKRKRKFWEGPGSINSLTPYGRFQTSEQVVEYLSNKNKNQNYEKYLFEDLIGTCEIAINKKCAPKSNFYAEKFNLLNDFINISIVHTDKLITQDAIYFDEATKKYKFTKESLNLIFEYCISHNKVIVSNMLKTLFGIDVKDTEGYRTNKQQKPEFATMNYYRYISKIWNDYNLDDFWINDIEKYNRVIYYLTVAPGIVETTKMIECDEIIEYSLSSNEKEALKAIQDKLKKEGMLRYHSLSEEILKKAINDMLKCQMNFIQVRKKFDYDKEAREYFSRNYSQKTEGMPHINPKYVDNIIASPQVKKTLRQAIHLINAIIDQKKALPKIIAIESTKEMNSQERKSELEKAQKKREELRKKAADEISEFYGDSYVTETNKEKVMLYHEVNGQCPYCNHKISLNDVLDGKIQVEHILPLRESFNDSYDNKTISCVNCNHEKSNRTPYQYLFPLGSYESYKKRIQFLNQISEEKRQNFLCELDISKYTTRFFNRNLRDTAYATKELVHQIKMFNDYLELNYKNSKVLTLSTPGQLTSKVRRQQNLDKDRDAGKFHHAVDAGIVGAIATTSFGEILIESQNDPKFWKNQDCKKLTEKSDYIYRFNLSDYKEQLKEIDSDDKIQISTEIRKNPQGALSNANLYKVFEKNGNYYKIEQVDNIYKTDFSKEAIVKLFNKLFDEADSSLTLLCQDNDINLFNYLKEIYLTRKGKENPFVLYCKEKYGLDDEEKFDYLQYGIHVPSKKKNSPLVVRLRYYQKITIPYLIEKKSIHKKKNTLISLYSLSQYCTKIFIDLDKNKFVFLPIYSISVDLNRKKIKENDQFYQTIYQKYIGNKNVQFITTLYNGNWIEVEKTNKVIKGEYSTFDIDGNRIRLKDKSSFTTSDLSLTVYDIDILGNRKKRLTYRTK